MTTPNPRILSPDERRAAADGYEPGLLGAAMERILAAQDAKTRRATVEEAKAKFHNSAYNGADIRAALILMLAPPEPEMVSLVRWGDVTGIVAGGLVISIPLADWERYAKGKPKS